MLLPPPLTSTRVIWDFSKIPSDIVRGFSEIFSQLFLKIAEKVLSETFTGVPTGIVPGFFSRTFLFFFSGILSVISFKDAYWNHLGYFKTLLMPFFRISFKKFSRYFSWNSATVPCKISQGMPSEIFPRSTFWDFSRN